jgi:serine protease AprX
MLKTNYNFLKKITCGLLSINFVLMSLVILFALPASAENMNLQERINTEDKISPDLASRIEEAEASEKINVIIILKNQHTDFNTPSGKSKIEREQKEILTFLESATAAGKAQDINSINIANAISAAVTPDMVTSLTKRPDVSEIELDEIVYVEDDSVPGNKMIPAIKSGNKSSTVVWGLDKINATAVWKKGITGKGVVVAVLDSGVDATHPDLAHLPNSKEPKIVGWIDYVNGKSSPYDDKGHGTHVCGTISGIGTNGYQTGVAPGSKLIVAKTFTNDFGNVSRTLLAFDWAVKNNARVISFSNGRVHSDAFTIAINNVIAAGVIPVIAAGNKGPNFNTTICPGDEINSTTVGATNSSDIIANFSSRGPVTLNKKTYIKPNVCAPGVDVISTMPGGNYMAKNGTSMSTPHVSGTIALMLEKNPSLKPSQINKILESTAVDLGQAGKDNVYGAGRIDAYKAVFSVTDKALPIANFTSNITNGPAPLIVKFTDFSKDANKWKWDFGDGTYSTAKSPKHTYSKPGNYSVKLTISNKDGSSTKTKNNYIKVAVLKKPVADFFGSPKSGKAPLNVTFTDTSTGKPKAWKWSFGDGTYSTAKSPKHTYSKTGIYSVKFTISNKDGSSTKTKNNYIKVTA